MKIASIKTVALNEGLEANIKIVDGKRTYILERSTVKALYRMHKTFSREELFNLKTFLLKTFAGLRDKFKVTQILIEYNFGNGNTTAIFGIYDLADKRQLAELVNDCIIIIESSV